MQSKIRIGHSDYYIVRKDSKVKVIRASAVGEVEVIIYDYKTGLEKGIAYSYISDVDDYVTFMTWVYSEIAGIETVTVRMSIIKNYKLRNKRLTDDIMIDMLNNMNGDKLEC